MWLTRVSVQNPYLAAVMMLLLTVLGLFAWKQLPVEEFPDIRFPVAVVSATYPGASPEVIESEVTRPLEEAVNTINGVKHIRSYSSEGVATLVVEFELSTDPAIGLQEVRDKVGAAMPVVETDRQPRARRGGDDVGRRIAGVQLGNLDIARLEKFGAFIKDNRLDLRKDRHQSWDRIVGQVRVSDMALRSSHRNPHIDGSAPANFHHVTKPVDACWFTDKTCVGNTAACLHMRD